jgi:hypothetical protein
MLIMNESAGQRHGSGTVTHHFMGERGVGDRVMPGAARLIACAYR